jgi:hypothetical protein
MLEPQGNVIRRRLTVIQAQNIQGTKRAWKEKKNEMLE